MYETHTTMMGVFTLLAQRYSMLQLHTSLDGDAAAHGGPEVLKAKLAFMEEKVYDNSDGFTNEPIFNQWLQEFETSRQRAVMNTTAKQAARGELEALPAPSALTGASGGASVGSGAGSGVPAGCSMVAGGDGSGPSGTGAGAIVGGVPAHLTTDDVAKIAAGPVASAAADMQTVLLRHMASLVSGPPGGASLAGGGPAPDSDAAEFAQQSSRHRLYMLVGVCSKRM
ncbi:hypothetical protein CYMTET_7697 [Cymbomonas tetramitiformis]|uniref:Uncharacterized protein n=1 Tax=Cymbomonas tetramitiformis TaxID=36881 RepID=A0AAE0GUJ0_9CHLO|nr:hypothetical protein CYMTET_7697 [Cymbomonas tetramitiformis]